MALSKKRDTRLEALIVEAAAEVRRLNPHIGDAPEPLTDSDYAEIERGRQELAHAWDEIERQRGQSPIGEPAAEAVNEDRGE